MIQRQELIDLVDQFLLSTESESYVIDITVSRDNQIVITLDNDEAIDIDECAALSQYLGDKLGTALDEYDMEVGSAGLTSPLRTLRQFAKFEGDEMEVLMRDGRKLIGTLGAADEQGFDLTWTTLEKVTDPVTGKPSKKKQEVVHNEHLLHSEVNQVKYHF